MNQETLPAEITVAARNLVAAYLRDRLSLYEERGEECQAKIAMIKSDSFPDPDAILILEDKIATLNYMTSVVTSIIAYLNDGIISLPTAKTKQQEVARNYFMHELHHENLRMEEMVERGEITLNRDLPRSEYIFAEEDVATRIWKELISILNTQNNQ